MRAVDRLRGLPPALRLSLLSGAAAAVVAAVLSLPPLPQPESFHDFADQRPLFGIPNFANVASNLAFLAAGIGGLAALRDLPAAAWPRLGGRLPYRLLAAGLLLVTFGSAYYHWAPSTQALYWDRLPIVLAFMALFAAIVAERLGPRAGLWLLPVLLALGLAAAEHWRRSELAGAGDLRLYLLVQILPATILPLLLLLFAGNGHDRLLLAMLLLYGVAMLLERLDRQVFALLGGAVSGHTLKHLLAAAAAYAPFHRLRLVAG